LEEAYEVFDAIERRDWPHLKDELGDLLLQVLFYAEMAANEGHFTIAEVLDNLNGSWCGGIRMFLARRLRGRRGTGRMWTRRFFGECCGIGRRSRRRRHCMQRTRHCMQQTRLRRKNSRSRGWMGCNGRCRRWPRLPSWGQGAEGWVRLAELERFVAQAG